MLSKGFIFFNQKQQIVRFLRILQINLFFQIKLLSKIVFTRLSRVSRYFTEANSRKGSKQVENSKKMVISLRLFVAVVNTLQHTHINENEIPRELLIFTVNARSLNPKLKQKSSFLVLHPSSCVRSVKTVGSHLN